MEKFKTSEKFNLKAFIDYSPQGIISRQIIRNHAGNCTLFSFDQGQMLSKHVSEYDSMIQIIDGEAIVIIDGNKTSLTENEVIIMPANIPHELRAEKRFKMILTTIKG